ncbi:MAG: lycopene cyclase [Rhodococcus sp.]|uniref:lycopene cyclase family protein n=1 Tax=Rhodococcus TaxID=1827 RepID=UPI0016B5363E|nr:MULTISPECIES: lycopene cyclase family protein [Rhodococcus]NLV79978.1 lycopene cyclase [Rhodococcus sp. (in: high G+C Gram-positive bacteria)]
MTVPATDVLVAGLGPAGRALAARCAHAGLSVVAVDPVPGRRWTATYGAWADELPEWLPGHTVAATVAKPAAFTTHMHLLDRPYRILDTGAVQDALSLDDVTVVTGRVTSLGRGEVLVDGHGVLRAKHVVDARGLPLSPDRAQQSAFGVITDATTAAGALDGHAAWFMDWRRDNGTGTHDTPSFLYAMPLGGDRVLLEETCLVGRPTLPLPELQRRLTVRLESRGVRVPATAPVERVRFTVQHDGRRNGAVTGFGARGGLMHPATGYAVATALAVADPLAAAVRSGLDPARWLWPPSARAVAALRRTGLRVLLDLDPAAVPAFFAAFLDLPEPQQRAYLSARTDLRGTAASMRALFGALPPRMRWALIRALA